MDIVEETQEQDEQPVEPAQEVVQEQPNQQRRQFHNPINSPWILLVAPLVFGGVWLANNTWVITNNINKPYALLAAPVAVASVLVGWLVYKFFEAIVSWCKSAYKAFVRTKKEDGSAQFFWTVIIVFLVVSVFSSGSFFSTLEHHALPGLGYVTALFIDLIAVQAMRARLNAHRMRDKGGKWLYLFGVLLCAGASAFANVYTSLADFNSVATGALPSWMLQVAPWFGLVFPALILLLSVTADYTLDQTSTKLDPDNYKLQEEKRVKMLEVQRDVLKKRVQIEQEIDHYSAQLHVNQTGFFFMRWLRPRNQNMTAIMIEQLKSEFTPWFQHLDAKMQQSYTSIVNTNTAQIQLFQRQLKQLEFEMNAMIEMVANQSESVQPSVHFVDTKDDIKVATFPVVEDDTEEEDTPVLLDEIKEYLSVQSSEHHQDTDSLPVVDTNSPSAMNTVESNLRPSRVHAKKSNSGRGDAQKRAERVLKKYPGIGATDLATKAQISRTYANKILSTIK